MILGPNVPHNAQVIRQGMFCLPKKEKTVSKGKDVDFLLQQSIRSSPTSYSQNAGFDVTPVVAPEHGPVSCSSDLVTYSCVFQRYTDGVYF